MRCVSHEATRRELTRCFAQGDLERACAFFCFVFLIRAGTVGEGLTPRADGEREQNGSEPHRPGTRASRSVSPCRQCFSLRRQSFSPVDIADSSSCRSERLLPLPRPSRTATLPRWSTLAPRARFANSRRRSTTWHVLPLLRSQGGGLMRMQVAQLRRFAAEVVCSLCASRFEVGD